MILSNTEKNITEFKKYFEEYWIPKNLNKENLDFYNSIKELDSVYIVKILKEKLYKKYISNNTENLNFNNSIISLLSLMKDIPKDQDSISLLFAIKMYFTFEINLLISKRDFIQINNLLETLYPQNEIENNIKNKGIEAVKFYAKLNKIFERIKVVYSHYVEGFNRLYNDRIFERILRFEEIYSSLKNPFLETKLRSNIEKELNIFLEKRKGNKNDIKDAIKHFNKDETSVYNFLKSEYFLRLKNKIVESDYFNEIENLVNFKNKYFLERRQKELLEIIYKNKILLSGVNTYIKLNFTYEDEIISVIKNIKKINLYNIKKTKNYFSLSQIIYDNLNNKIKAFNTKGWILSEFTFQIELNEENIKKLETLIENTSTNFSSKKAIEIFNIRSTIDDYLLKKEIYDFDKISTDYEEIYEYIRNPKEEVKLKIGNDKFLNELSSIRNSEYFSKILDKLESYNDKIDHIKNEYANYFVLEIPEMLNKFIDSLESVTQNIKNHIENLILQKESLNGDIVKSRLDTLIELDPKIEEKKRELDLILKNKFDEIKKSLNFKLNAIFHKIEAENNLTYKDISTLVNEYENTKYFSNEELFYYVKTYSENPSFNFNYKSDTRNNLEKDNNIINDIEKFSYLIEKYLPDEKISLEKEKIDTEKLDLELEKMIFNTGFYSSSDNKFNPFNNSENMFELLEPIFLVFRYLTRDNRFYIENRISNDNPFEKFIISIFSDIHNPYFINTDRKEYILSDLIGLEFFVYNWKNLNKDSSIIKIETREDINWNEYKQSISQKLENYFNNQNKSSIPIYNIDLLERCLPNPEHFYSNEMKENFIIDFFNSFIYALSFQGEQDEIINSFLENPIYNLFSQRTSKGELFRILFSFIFDKSVIGICKNSSDDK